MKPELVDKFPGMAALEVIYEDYARDCTRCGLHKSRNEVVFGTGCSEDPDVAFIGDAPSRDDDQKGYPFQGPDGKLLDKMLAAMGYDRTKVYLLSAISCKPRRSPTKTSLKSCWPIMASQLRAVRPRVIVCLGAVAAKQLLQRPGTVDNFRNSWYRS